MSNCYCIVDNKFDFIIDYKDCKTMIFKDLSQWMTKPDTYELIITPVGSNKEYKKIINSTFDIIKSEDIGLSIGVNLPDGIYTFSVEICGKKYIKKDIFLCTMTCQLANEIAAINLCDETELKTKLEEIQIKQLKLDAIRYNKVCCKWNRIKDLFNSLKEDLKNNNGNCSCM